MYPHNLLVRCRSLYCTTLEKTVLTFNNFSILCLLYKDHRILKRGELPIVRAMIAGKCKSWWKFNNYREQMRSKLNDINRSRVGKMYDYAGIIRNIY